MDLFREEYLLKLGPNKGQKLYEQLKAREAQDCLQKNKCPVTKKVVQDKLDLYPDTSVLDASEVLTLTDDDQCEFFQKFSQSSIKCHSLILRNWTFISDKVLRSISISLGDTLLDLDLSCSRVNGEQFETLMARIPRLKKLNVSHCGQVDGKCMSFLSRYACNTMTELYAIDCALFKFEPLQWIAGALGIQAKRLSKLSVLDVSDSPVEDRGMVVVGEMLSRIRYLNLGNCDDISDAAVVAIAQNNTKLEVINLSGCQKITNKAVMALTRCTLLVSVNLSRCSKISDKSLTLFSRTCPHLQAINLAGLFKVSEATLCALVTYCKGLLMLNITGCELITVTGLKELIRGIPYVELARAFFGFRPVEDHIERKLSAQLVFRKQTAATAIQHTYKAAVSLREEAALARVEKERQSAIIIQNYIRRFKHRMAFFHIWADRKRFLGCLSIQRVWRGYMGRIRAEAIRKELAIQRQMSMHICTIQKILRGHLSRKKNSFVANEILNMYACRRKEAETALIVRIQSSIRRYMAQSRLVIYKELLHRRHCVETSAAHVLQCAIRVMLSKCRLCHRRAELKRLIEVRLRSAVRIQSFYRACKGRVTATQTAFEIRLRRLIRDKKAIFVQRVFRGYRGRQLALKRRVHLAALNFAAATIQRVFRGSLVLHWRDMRMNIISAFILDRQFIERKDRLADARERYRHFLYVVRKDSASDDEPEPEHSQWVQYYDDQNQEYWFNGDTQEVSYEQPRSSVHHEMQLIGRLVRIYWPMQREWYQGTVVKFHRLKMRHRVDYEDGDHEWLNIDKERERVQVQLDEGGWVMYQLYRPPDLVSDYHRLDARREAEDFKAMAWRDAQQWRGLVDDKTQKVLFMSEETGEMRAGKDDAFNWVIQDDGYGFPMFFNMKTSESAHEDPRFEEEQDVHAERQRSFILHELRYTMYFCRDYWQQYTGALRINDDKRVHSIMKIINKSSKPKLLAALVLQTKQMFRQTSVLDKVDESIEKEIEYAAWLVERLSDLSMKAKESVAKANVAKFKALKNIVHTNVEKVFCFYCKHETQRNLQYCPTCGKIQVFMK